MVVDFHTHCFPDELAARAVPALAKDGGIEARLDGTVKDLKGSMRKAGVDKSVVLPIATKPSQTQKINDWSAEIQDEDIIAFGTIHPNYEGWEAEIRRVKQLGLKGIKFHPDYQEFYVDEPRMMPVYDLIFELGLIIVFHAGLDIGLSPPYHCTPRRLLRLLRTFPGGKIVAAHMGGYSYWDEVEEVLVGEEIYFDTSYSLDWMAAGQAGRIIENHGYRKILFATDSPWTDQSEQIQKIKRLGLESTVEEAILGGNARNLLGL